MTIDNIFCFCILNGMESGTSEIQRLVIAGQVLKEYKE